MYKTEKIASDTFEPKRFESDGKLTLKGQEITYHTVSEDNVFYSAEGKALASIFSYSYFRTDTEDVKSRPVIFGFNGGPGSSSMYVHAGFLAPRRIQYVEDPNAQMSLPPYPVIDNPDCLLDVADIVIVDAVGTGFSQLIDEKAKDEFYGIEADAEVLLSFIEGWLSRYDRWLSPKFLCGESYGCTRSATAAGISVSGGKERSYVVRFDGLVLIGNTVTPAKYFAEDIPVEKSVLYLPTFAAINWYHNHPSDKTVEEFVAEAKAFADNEYLLALYRGEALQGDERERFIEKLRYYSGVSRAYLEDNALRIDEDTFRAELLKDKKLAVGRCDGRFLRPHYNPGIAETRDALFVDAMDDHYDGLFYGALTGSIFPSLNIHLDRNYVSSLPLWRDWKTETKGGNTAERLRDAMNQTLGMRTFFANGWYDACTEIGFVYYTLDHAGLPKDRCFVKGYPSGHMIYVGEENIAALSSDIRRFIGGEGLKE